MPEGQRRKGKGEQFIVAEQPDWSGEKAAKNRKKSLTSIVEPAIINKLFTRADSACTL